MRTIFLFFTFLSLTFADIFNFETISSKFTQTITNDQNQQIVYKGSFYATSKQKALWIYESPVEKRIYFNQNEVVIIEPELEQAIITTLEKTPNIAELLKSAKKLEDKTYLATYEDIKYQVHIIDNEIKKITYTDRLENSVKITLENPTRNTFLDDVLFQTTIPQGYDVITQ